MSPSKGSRIRGPPGTQHTPWAYDTIDGVSGGGWAACPSVCASCHAYVQTGMTVPLTFDPALTFLEHVDGEVFCSSLNGYLWESGFVDINFEEAITYSKNVGGSSGAWQLQDWCTPESSPPDWRPTQAISRTNYPYFKGLTICKRKSGSPRGSPWSCNPNPTPAANGAIDPTLQVCTNWDAGTHGTWP
jgi:hypothetical protein